MKLIGKIVMGLLQQSVVLLAAALIVTMLSADEGNETDPEDLGFITPKRGIRLIHDDARPDFRHFVVEVFPRTPPTNRIELTVTNDMLMLPEFVRAPSGPALLAVRSVCRDGAMSPISLFLVDIRRGEPKRPRARSVARIDGRQLVEQSATNLLHQRKARRESQILTPPAPGGVRTNVTMRTSAQGAMAVIPPALPCGTNEDYGQFRDRQAAYYLKQGRRSQ